jgi:AcrR family transcriptional regulator
VPEVNDTHFDSNVNSFKPKTMSRSTTSSRTGRANPTAPGRSRDSRDVLDHDRILDVALGLFLECGPGRIRLAELARRLGVVPSALHYHFAGGKEEVISALFDREESRLLDAMTSAVAAADSARSRLLAVATVRLGNATRVARLYRSDASHGDVARGDRSQANEIQEYVRQRRQRFLERERRLISQIVREATESRASDSSVELLAVAFQGALFNVTRTFSLTASRRSHAVLAEVVDLFIHGIEARR